MQVRTVLVILVVVLLAAFAALNWSAFVAPTTLSLGFTEVQAPLGLIMLAAAGVLTVLFLAYIVLQQAGVIVETRRYAKELKSHRELADKAEASRFTELRAFLDGELRRLEGQINTVRTELAERIDGVDKSLAARVTDTGAGLEAHLGEVEDKLDRALPSPRAEA